MTVAGASTILRIALRTYGADAKVRLVILSHSTIRIRVQ